MEAYLPHLLCALGAYVIGATPVGYMAGKLNGIDIREHGSGNIGATNVLRVLGKKTGIPVFIIDFLKGLLPVLLALKLTNNIECGIAAGLGAILGHNFTFWLKFKGGKGVATSAGVLLGLMPVPMLCVLATWIVVFYASRYVAVASILAAAVLPVFVWWQHSVGSLFWFSLAIGLLAIYRHRSNIQRLMNGTENRFSRKESVPPQPNQPTE
jgi:glycerol-3-phosphate acyltransferase PlsY